ncbi:hypothetical protein ACIQXA_33115 [Streptomyces massasporeus]|uniref:hypothetical protein n=1 Tax=Streptomyces massasporeus TaxID=67324 RepID=UPI003816403B
MRQTRRSRTATLAVTALTLTLLATGCTPDGTSVKGTAGDTAPAGSPSAPVSADPDELARMQKLLDGAESAVNDADADAVADE